ncbi:MAG TPA: peptidase [Chloroflexi bacterium]|jgi:Zn-dependent protease|nr:peptidase [Chloroflexota bacterium]HAL27518.1 peptidase [Chloroflexota bacterium]
MPGSFRVARLFGIEIRIHISWVVIFGLVFFSLWNDVFPSQYPFWSDQKTLLVSAVTAVLFFCSIIAHELSHSLVARRFNMRVSSITLFLLGGVANLQQEPPSAKAEFFMAAAGPFMSVCIGGLGLGLQTLIDATDAVQLQTVAAVAGYLGFINLLLAGFNMIPGFPLDGGRVLRSIIWAIRRDRAKATGIAARGGQLVAGLFVLWALAQLTTEGAGGLWWWPILIAYFLYNAATQSLRQERLGGLVAGTRVAPLMNTTFAVADPRSTVANVVRDLMLPRSLRAVPVVANQDFLGLMTSDDVRKIDHDRWATTPVEEVMTRSADLPKLAPDDDLGQALARFGDGTVLPVVRDGRLVGLLDRDGVLDYIRMRDLFAQGR